MKIKAEFKGLAAILIDAIKMGRLDFIYNLELRRWVNIETAFRRYWINRHLHPPEPKEEKPAAGCCDNKRDLSAGRKLRGRRSWRR